MHLITRKQLGWPASAAPTQPTAKGVKVHYTGGHVPTSLLKDHSGCLQLWRDIRAAHLANVAEGYSDVAYNYAACVHGYVLEGRGVGRRTGANGNQALNKAHYAVLGLIGSGGLTEPTDELLNAIRDAIEQLQEHGAGPETKGHKDGYPTACPGGPLYAWVKAGAPRPGGGKPTAPKPSAPARPVVDCSKVRAAALADPPRKGTPVSYAGVKTVEDALVKEGLLARSLADGHFGTATVTAYAAWQRRCGWRGDDADGIPGKSSLTKLGARRGFDVTE
ncbi:N-acetylmuramoyl-L-alanine amidase [Streptomyces sp. NPDC050164]|uniref:N-acetylmuramoyl-L-alanine amidase n=1 Tax=Streptomyces sp. NPDC050164 TaxID=3365605 RepID=UPI0037B84796